MRRRGRQEGLALPAALWYHGRMSKLEDIRKQREAQAPAVRVWPDPKTGSVAAYPPGRGLFGPLVERGRDNSVQVTVRLTREELNALHTRSEPMTSPAELIRRLLFQWYHGG